MIAVIYGCRFVYDLYEISITAAEAGTQGLVMLVAVCKCHSQSILVQRSCNAVAVLAMVGMILRVQEPVVIHPFLQGKHGVKLFYVAVTEQLCELLVTECGVIEVVGCEAGGIKGGNHAAIITQGLCIALCKLIDAGSLIAMDTVQDVHVQASPGDHA